MADHSATSLAKKLGWHDNILACIHHSPESYALLLAGHYSIRAHRQADLMDWLQAFYADSAVLQKEFPVLKRSLAPAGQLWISWPKKSSHASSGLSEAIVRDVGLANGLVDVKVVAIDETWSALKFVYRLTDRQT